jgi:NAD(P)H-hydrate epimerase
MKCIEQLPQLPPRTAHGHKGLFGRVLVIGGSSDMIGAPVLAATAALRMGSGLVQIGVPRGNLAACLTITPELIGLGLSASIPAAAIEKADAIVVGPGLGQSPRSRQWVAKLIRVDKPMVIDADALNILASGKRWPAAFKAKAVLTPHPGEMKRLIALMGKKTVPTDDAGRIELAGAAARAWKVVIVLKGERTVISDGERFHVNDTGDSSLSKGGSGDVLSGMIGCLLGQKMSGFDAACLGVNLHGTAGEMAGRKLGRRSVLARDVIEMFSKALTEADSIASIRDPDASAKK